MSLARTPAALDALRRQVRLIETADAAARTVLPFGVPQIDERLPGGGLAIGALHEVAGGADGALHAATPARFAAGILARAPGPVLWCLRQRDLFAPALAQVGLPPARVIFAEAGDEAGVLACMEEGLRWPGLAGVVGEVGKLSMTASRRLQLAAEKSGQMAIAIRRWRRVADAADLGQPTAAATRWRVSALPSSPLPTAGVGRPRWFLELFRCRAGEAFDLEIEACDAKGHLRLPAPLADRPAASRPGQGRAAA
ncbi:damage-inducible protein [Caulobacter flavus]|uniref:Damage-inducible protein n=1 Tax=Caulobacter flavus TaxID=1679497 RepID=A0A2N5CP57_9CAUL|nr:damage-inducible protein [Caulobacter flavus]AYV48552.1 damage-inducible protein [Caulobacter flavus]PLR08732.1 damage-inducible protein [Caulobacter flavus]